MTENPLLLERQLCFPLYACSRAMIKAYRPFLMKLGLTYTQYLVMLVLWSEKRIQVKDLGSQLYLDSGTLTPLLKKMEANRLLVRERSAEDERVLFVRLTEQGEKLRKQAVDIPLQMRRCLSVSQTETKTLYELLYSILHTLK